MAEEITHECSVCKCDYSDAEGGVQGEFGILPVSFCPTCFSCMCDMAGQFRDAQEEEEEEEIKPEHAEFLKHLRGITHVVINSCYGGFSLSHQAQISYLESACIPYTLEFQPDRDKQTRLGPRIMVNGKEFYDRFEIKRDDPVLVSVVRRMKKLADGEHAELKIVSVPADIEWTIENYDGREWIAEAHRTWQ